MQRVNRSSELRTAIKTGYLTSHYAKKVESSNVTLESPEILDTINFVSNVQFLTIIVLVQIVKASRLKDAPK